MGPRPGGRAFPVGLEEAALAAGPGDFLPGRGLGAPTGLPVFLGAGWAEQVVHAGDFSRLRRGLSSLGCHYSVFRCRGFSVALLSTVGSLKENFAHFLQARFTPFGFYCLRIPGLGLESLAILGCIG